MWQSLTTVYTKTGRSRSYLVAYRQRVLKDGSPLDVQVGILYGLAVSLALREAFASCQDAHDVGLIR